MVQSIVRIVQIDFMWNDEEDSYDYRYVYRYVYRYRLPVQYSMSVTIRRRRKRLTLGQFSKNNMVHMVGFSFAVMAKIQLVSVWCWLAVKSSDLLVNWRWIFNASTYSMMEGESRLKSRNTTNRFLMDFHKSTYYNIPQSNQSIPT